MKIATLPAILGLALGAAISLPLASGQTRGGGTTTPPQPSPQPQPGGTVGRPGQPGSIPGQAQPDYGQPRLENPEQPFFLSGRVLLDDGTPPPESVVIERVCNGRNRPEAYTDSKGRFSFQLGQNNSLMIADASSEDSGGFGMPRTGTQRSGGGSNLSERDLYACEIRASLPGYRSDLVSLAGRRRMDNPDLGTIVLHRLGNVEGTTISATSILAPKDAKKAFEKGSEALRKKKYEEAEKQLQKAVEIYPKYAAAWNALGEAQQKQSNIEGARKAFEQSLVADSKYLAPYLHLAALSLDEKKWQDAADASDRLIRLDPVDYPGAYFFSAVANLNLAMAGDAKRLEEAEKSAREALKLDPNHRMPGIHHVLGVILANKRDFTGAAEQLKSYLQYAPSAQDGDQVRRTLVEVEKHTSDGTAAR
jgi:tetratricopeptide (TPR) repeat protein